MVRVNHLRGGASKTATVGASVIAAVIVAAAFTFVSVSTSAISGSTADPGTILGMSGRVQIETSGSNEWRPLVPSDVIRTGDMVMTGSDGQLLVGLAGVGQVRFGEETNFTTSESGFTVESSSTNSSSDPSGVTRCNLHLGLHLGGHCHLFELLVGSMWASIQEAVGGSDVYETNIGSSCAVGIRGTEFTATAYGNGTSNVMVLNGLVEVQDLASNSTVSLQANQMVTVPNVSGGLSEQNMSQRVATVNPNSIDRWWETPLATTSTTLAPLQQLLQPTALEVGAVVVAVVVAAASVLYVRSRKGK